MSTNTVQLDIKSKESKIGITSCSFHSTTTTMHIYDIGDKFCTVVMIDAQGNRTSMPIDKESFRNAANIIANR